MEQETVSAGTSSTILRGLQPDTVYSVSLVPVYNQGDGKASSETGKTSESTHKHTHKHRPSATCMLNPMSVQGRWAA